MSTVRVTVHKRFMAEDSWDEIKESPTTWEKSQGGYSREKTYIKYRGNGRRKQCRIKKGKA